MIRCYYKGMESSRRTIIVVMKTHGINGGSFQRQRSYTTRIYSITREHKALSFIIAFATVYTAWRMYKLGFKGVTELHCIWRN